MLQAAPVRHNLDLISKCIFAALPAIKVALETRCPSILPTRALEILLPAIHLAKEVNITGTGETLLSRAIATVVAGYKQAGAGARGDPLEQIGAVSWHNVHMAANGAGTIPFRVLPRSH
jgi:hypothetical protein